MRLSRTAVTAPNAMIATSHSLAAQAGLGVMASGGNAIDAVVAATAVLGVVEPMSTGIGGDCFALIWHAESRQLYALNGSGPMGSLASIESVQAQGHSEMPAEGILGVTVPGTVRGWGALLERFGSQSLSTLLEPAIAYADKGYPVSKIVASRWHQHADRLGFDEDSSRTFMPDGRTPAFGEIFRNRQLARSLSQIAEQGVDVYYEGEIAEKIVGKSQHLGGFLTESDLHNYQPTWETPISTTYRDTEIFEHSPNTQGLIPLIAMNIAEGFELHNYEHNSVDVLHLMIESIKLAFADGKAHTADPKYYDAHISELLSKAFAAKRRHHITDRAATDPAPGEPEGGTVYISAVDVFGNVVSFIESVFMPFGSGITAGDTGIMLQNRGALSSLDANHPNSLEAGKRPYHTILPAMAFRDHKPWLSFGMVGGFMQPQGHLQMISNIVDHNMDVQEAIESPRFRFYEGRKVALEHGISAQTRKGLAARGHEIIEGDYYFGGAQAIQIDSQNGALIGGSDPRKDGCAQGY